MSEQEKFKIGNAAKRFIKASHMLVEAANLRAKFSPGGKGHRQATERYREVDVEYCEAFLDLERMIKDLK